MKTFINVLYRRILYKIPLKLLLILLAVFAVLFACTKAENVSDLTTNINSFNGTISSHTFKDVIQLNNTSAYGTYCLKLNNINDTLYFGMSNNGYSLNSEFYYGLYSDWDGQYVCIYSNFKYIFLYNPLDTSVSINYDLFKLNALLNTQLPVLSSLECQTTYNLIPISSVDSNYCTTNNLCPIQEIPEIGTGNLTQLYINNILHVGAPTILMNIPDEIDWDYAYTMGGNIMNIDIVGYNVDYQVVEDEITIQKYKPSSAELSGIISGLIPLFVPGLCIILLLYFIFKFIKKVF